MPCYGYFGHRLDQNPQLLEFAPLARFFKPLFYSHFDYAICYEESSRNELLSYGFPSDRVCVANNTIDTRRIFIDDDGIRSRGETLRRSAGLQGKKILLSIGRMYPEKRHEDLLDAWPQIAALDPDLCLLIVSDGPLLETIQSKARALDPNRIIITGRVPEGDDYAWTAACEVGIYPGAVGLAINVAMAFGKPTIIADERGADSEILETRYHGLAFPTRGS